MSEETDEALLKMFKFLLANQVEQAGRLDALEVLLVEAALRLGDDPSLYEGKLRTVAATCHQKRLEEIEARNPAMAAFLDHRELMPPIDEDLLRALNYRLPENLQE